MRFSEISRCLECKEYYKGSAWETTEVQSVTAGDLMSEVLVFEKDNLLLVTALNSEQTLRTASMVDALGVVLVNGKSPNEKMIALARELSLSLLSTPNSMFDTCVALSDLSSTAGCGA